MRNAFDLDEETGGVDHTNLLQELNLCLKHLLHVVNFLLSLLTPSL